MLVLQERPCFLFVEDEHEEHFLYTQIPEIYEIIMTNFDIEVPVVGYEVLNDNQTYTDLIPEVILPNYQAYFKRVFGEITSENFNVYMKKMNEDHGDILLQLSDDIVNAFRFHDMFFTECCERNICFTYNYPVKKVW